MGGGGSYYDRDIQDGYARTPGGFSPQAAEKMGRRAADPGLLPKDRRLECVAKCPVVYAFDVTGSMGNLPRIIYDKMPMIAGQITECGYLVDAQMSLSAIGDILSDQAPLQVAEFSLIRKLDDWLQRVWLEGNGGGQAAESYEYTAYFYARMCDLKDAEVPFFIITGDEGFRETLYGSDLVRHFGGTHKNTEAADVFEELKRKFKGNVFMIRRRYAGEENDKIQAQWEKALGADYVIPLGSDQAIADVTLGLFALMTGSRTLDEYLDDLKTKRDVAQTDERIAEVRESLRRVATLKPAAKLSAAPVQQQPPSSQPPEDPAPKKKGRLF
jgi:hypothetical protein